jgi:hypothetical protein
MLRNVEFLSAFGQHNYIVDELLAFDVCNTKGHLGLMVNEGNSRVVSGNQTAVSV